MSGGTSRKRYSGQTGHFVSTVPVKRRCPHCKGLTLVGFDGGIPYIVDLEPVDRSGEVDALVWGAWTYERFPGRTLRRREADDIRRKIHGPVHADHTCPGGAP